MLSRCHPGGCRPREAALGQVEWVALAQRGRARGGGFGGALSAGHSPGGPRGDDYGTDGRGAGREAGPRRRFGVEGRKAAMCAVRAVLFDLDGTLTQSEEGIWNCVRYAAEKYWAAPRRTRKPCAGLSGRRCFSPSRPICPVTEEEAGRAVDSYRERCNVLRACWKTGCTRVSGGCWCG